MKSTAARAAGSRKYILIKLSKDAGGLSPKDDFHAGNRTPFVSINRLKNFVFNWRKTLLNRLNHNHSLSSTFLTQHCASKYYSDFKQFSLSLMSPPLVRCCSADCFKRENAETRLATRCDYMARPIEKCQNPWKSECGNTNIEVYILHKKQQLPICTNCWRRIAEEDYEWRH